MEKRLIFLSVFFAFFQGISQVNQVDTKGKKQGKWEKTYPNSKAYEYRGQFKDDIPIGTFTYFYPSTKTKAIIKHDEKTGRSVAYMYHENGLALSFGIYRKQKKDSVWTYFGPSGRLSYKETYKNGKLNGKKTIYYVPEDPEDKSQLVAKVENYVDDVKQGLETEYFESGTVKSTGNYDKGLPVGKFTSYHLNGKPMIIEQYKYGNRHGWCFGYDENGAQTGKRYFKRGKELEGTELENWMKYCKEKGINPND